VLAICYQRGSFAAAALISCAMDARKISWCGKAARVALAQKQKKLWLAASQVEKTLIGRVPLQSNYVH